MLRASLIVFHSLFVCILVISYTLFFVYLYLYVEYHNITFKMQMMNKEYSWEVGSIYLTIAILCLSSLVSNCNISSFQKTCFIIMEIISIFFEFKQLRSALHFTVIMIPIYSYFNSKEEYADTKISIREIESTIRYSYLLCHS